MSVNVAHFSTDSAVSTCKIEIYDVEAQVCRVKICQNGVDCEFAAVDCRPHGHDCEPAIIDWVLLFEKSKNAFRRLQSHNCRYEASICHLRISHPGLHPSYERFAAHNRHLVVHNFKIVNCALPFGVFICWVASFLSLASNDQSSAYREHLALRRMQRTRGGRDPPFGTIQ